MKGCLTLAALFMLLITAGRTTTVRAENYYVNNSIHADSVFFEFDAKLESVIGKTRATNGR